MNKVLVDLHRIGKNPYNGLYTYCYQLGKSLIKMDTSGLDLFYYLPEKKFGIFGDDVKYYNQKSIDKFYKFNTSQFDLWHSTTTVSRYKPFNDKTKFIFTIHDLNFTIEDPGNTSRNKRLLKDIQSLVNRADHLITISQFAKQQASNLLDLGNKPLSVIYPGCSLVTDNVQPISPVYTPLKPFLFAIGLIEPRKNFHTLIPLLENNDYDLIIAGMDTHEYKQVIINSTNQLNMQNRVKLVGPISEGEKNWYYKNCEAFMFPSYAEGFGLPVVEAMFYGKPVFTSRETSLPEIAGDAAYYFDSFDPNVMKKNFEEGMHHYEEYLPIEKIKARAMLFTYDNTAAKCIEIYRALLS